MADRDAADAPVRSDCPALIGRYRVRSRLAVDAVGETFHGFDPLLERSVVIRVFHWPGLRPDETQALTLRFFEEVRRVGVLVHPGIVPLFDAGDCPSGLFMASEYVEGQSLADVLAQPAPLEPERAMTMLVQFAEAIDYAHRQGVAHQDLEPARARITPDAMVRVGGFGVAAVVDAMRGTADRRPSPYRAPESADGTLGGPRADLFALGAIAMALFGGSPRAAGAAAEEDWPVPAALAVRGATATRWNAFARQALALDPAARFASAEHLARELAALAGLEYAPAAPTWDPLAAIGLVADDGSGTESSGSSASAPALAPASPTATHAPALAADSRRHDDRDDDLTVTKM